MSAPVQYIVSEEGQRTGVVLDWEVYQKLRWADAGDTDLLSGLDDAELRGLAEGVLAPAFQARLDELLGRNDEGLLTAGEERELDDLLARIDVFNTLKARALYTLRAAEKAR